MKVETAVLETEGMLPGEVIEMTLDANSLPHLISVLTNLYENPTLAVIREYATNGRDANIQAGNDAPVEITLPSALAPYLRIKDQGVGLDKEDIREIYSKYGASTKRNSNDVVGMLGLGCKSALAYGDTFTLSAVKDGNKIEVSIAKNEDGGYDQTVVDEYTTDEPNGVEVIVPVTGYNYFEAEAKKFFYYWQKGTVLVNGEEPESIYDDPSVFWIAEDLAIVNQQNEDKIVMGNVAYPMEQNDWRRYYSVVRFVDIGEVNFVPSREALMMNSKTKAVIARTLERVQEEASAAVTAQVNAATSKPEALLAYNRFANIFRHQFEVKAEYQGKEIPDRMDAPLFGSTKQSFITVKATQYKNYREKGWHRVQSIPSSVWGKMIFVRGYDGADFSPYKRKKMDQWLEEMGDKVPEHETVVFTHSVPNFRWIDKGRFFNWQEIKDQKIVREGGNVKKQDGRVSGSYEGYVDGSYERQILAEDIDTNYPIMYTEKNYGYSSDAYDIVKREHTKFTWVQIGSNRVAKFKRDFPQATTLVEAAKKVAKAWEDSLTDDDKLHIVVVKGADGGYSSFDLNKLKNLKNIDDPELVEAIEHIANKQTKLLNKYNQFSSYVTLDVEWTNPLENYPLLQDMRMYGTLNSMQSDHVTLYLNAAYAARQEEV